MTAKRKALVIDDEPAIRRLLQTALKAHDIEILEAENGKLGLSQAIAVRPDFILLDLGLPDIDGIEVLAKLREWYTRPILVLSVRSQEETIVSALDRGADDYLTKPFSINELIARIRVAERRQGGNAEAEHIYDDISIHLPNRQVKKNDAEVKLTATEFDVLRVLVENQGRVLTHRQMLHAIWGPNSSEHVQYLRVYVGHLRQKLETDPNNPKWILTEPGVGYRWSGAGS